MAVTLPEVVEELLGELAAAARDGARSTASARVSAYPAWRCL